MKKALSLILAVIMCLSVAVVIPIFASAKNAEIAETSAAKLATPKITKLTGTASGVKITIAKVNGAAKYAYFFLSNHKWKSIGVTAATSFVHKGVKSGKRYIYTVRCVASNGKTFTSAYNKKGWVITYKKPASVKWSSLYKSFVLNKKYLTVTPKNLFGGKKNYITNDEFNQPAFTLCDIDLNGIPELIGYSGLTQYSRHYYMHFYTIKNNKVSYLGYYDLASQQIKYVKGYKGIFCHGGRDAFRTDYCTIKNGKLFGKQITSEGPKDYRDYSKGMNVKVLDKSLYNIYKNKKTIELPYGGFTFNQIKSMGWKAFLKKYGY